MICSGIEGLCINSPLDAPQQRVIVLMSSSLLTTGYWPGWDEREPRYSTETSWWWHSLSKPVVIMYFGDMANTEVERQKNTLISPFLIYFFQTLICIGFNSKIASQIHIIGKEIQKYLLKIWTNLDNKYKEFVIRNTRSENCLKWAKSPCFPAERANAIWKTVSWQQHGGWSEKRLSRFSTFK